MSLAIGLVCFWTIVTSKQFPWTATCQCMRGKTSMPASKVVNTECCALQTPDLEVWIQWLYVMCWTTNFQMQPPIISTGIQLTSTTLLYLTNLVHICLNTLEIATLNCDRIHDNSNMYTFRCGRTGRIGGYTDCRVDNFVSTQNEVAVVRKIEKAIRKMKPIPIFDISEQQEKDEVYEPFGSENKTNETEQEFSIPYWIVLRDCVNKNFV